MPVSTPSHFIFFNYFYFIITFQLKHVSPFTFFIFIYTISVIPFFPNAISEPLFPNYYVFFFIAIDCVKYMANGSSLIKVRPSARQYRRFFRLENSYDDYALRWMPSSKKSSKARSMSNIFYLLLFIEFLLFIFFSIAFQYDFFILCNVSPIIQFQKFSIKLQNVDPDFQFFFVSVVCY